jgi:zinc transport system substrate-binding protein
MRNTLLALPLLLAPAHAPALDVVASIAPVHSLVAQVMEGTGAPRLLLPPGTSPHDHALRPSEAAALQGAEVIVRIGPSLERWLEGPLEALATEARVVTLVDVPGLTLLPVREGAAFEAHADAGDGDSHDGADHDEAHAHDATDPHVWLDPQNARLWLAAIAGALAQADPANEALYHANAARAQAALDTLAAGIEARLAPLRGRPFVVFHDAYQYFERRFRIEAAGAVALSDAAAPGPARIAAIRARLIETGARCVFREPQFRSAIVETVAEGTGARTGVLDPLGAGLDPGPGLYGALLAGLADGLADCLG